MPRSNKRSAESERYDLNVEDLDKDASLADDFILDTSTFSDDLFSVMSNSVLDEEDCDDSTDTSNDHDDADNVSFELPDDLKIKSGARLSRAQAYSLLDAYHRADDTSRSMLPPGQDRVTHACRSVGVKSRRTFARYHAIYKQEKQRDPDADPFAFLDEGGGGNTTSHPKAFCAGVSSQDSLRAAIRLVTVASGELGHSITCDMMRHWFIRTEIYPTSVSPSTVIRI